jgi:serine/threonine-protein kinase RsbW
MPTSSGPYEQPGSWNSPPAPLGRDWRWRRIFPGHQRELSELRRWLKSLLPDCPARDDVLCVANELATNAIQHTASGRDGVFAVEVAWLGPDVRVAVADGGAPDGPRAIDDPASEHGRGLLLVAGLSARTGVCGGVGGRLVWADVPWGDAGVPMSGSSRDPYESVIGDGEASLAGRFAGFPAWFGRATLQWWALGPGGLVSAPSAQELASILSRLAGSPAPGPPAGGGTGPEDHGTVRAWGGQQRHGLRLRSTRHPVLGRSRLLRHRSSRDVVMTTWKQMRLASRWGFLGRQCACAFTGTGGA